MERKLVSVLVAVIEDSNGDTREEQIARVDGEHSFTEEEKEQAQKQQAEEQWKLHKARFMAFSEEHNDKRKEE